MSKITYSGDAVRLKFWLTIDFIDIKMVEGKINLPILSHLYGHFGLVRLAVRGREQA